MKKVWILFATLGIMSCAKNDNGLSPDGFLEFQNEGIILGYEKIVDECKGGYMLNIYGDNSIQKIYVAQEMPPNTDIDSGSVFPMKIVLNWETLNTCPSESHIKIRKIKKNNN